MSGSRQQTFPGMCAGLHPAETIMRLSTTQPHAATATTPTATTITAATTLSPHRVEHRQVKVDFLFVRGAVVWRTGWPLLTRGTEKRKKFLIRVWHIFLLRYRWMIFNLHCTTFWGAIRPIAPQLYSHAWGMRNQWQGGAALDVSGCVVCQCNYTNRACEARTLVSQ